MTELMVPEPDDHSGPAGHARMDGILAEEQAEGRVVGIRLLTPDHVTGVYILKADLPAGLFEMFPDTFAKEDPDISVFDIARGVTFTRCFEELLAGALGNDDHGMPPLIEPLFQAGQKTIQRKGDLGNKTEVHL